MNKYYSRIILFNLFNKLTILNLIKETKYSIVMKHLYNKKLIENFKTFLIHLLENYSKYSYKNKKLNIDYKFTKKVLTIFLIFKFPSIIFTNETEYNESLIQISKSIFDILKKMAHDNTILYNIKLIDYLHKFECRYNLWSMLDKRINTYVFLKLYHSNIINKLEVPTESKLYDTLIKSIDNDQNEIVKSIEFMKDKNELNFFNHYKDNINYSKTIDEKLYLIELKYKLSKSPPDKLIFVELVSKTKHLLKLCVPNRKDHHIIIDTIFDTELMTTYINNNIIDDTYFYNIIHTIIDKVKEYQASAEDIELEEFRNKCNSRLKNNEFYKNFIPIFFIEVYNRLEKIIEEREAFIKLLNNK